MKRRPLYMLRILGAAALAGGFCLTALAGCAPGAQQSPPPASSETAGTGDESQPTPAAETGKVRILTGGALHAGGGEDGFYLPQVMGDGVFGTVVDTGTGQQRVLCSLPGCDHTGPDCEGWMCSAESLGEQAADSCALLCDGDTLLWLVFDDPVTENESYADVSAPDGTGRTRLADTLEGNCPAWSNWPNGFFTDGSDYYFLTSRDGSDAVLSRLDPGSGETTLTELPGGSPGTLIGTDGEAVLFWQQEEDLGHLLALDLAAARVTQRDSWLTQTPGVLGAAAADGTLYAAAEQEEKTVLLAGPAEGSPTVLAELPASPDGAQAVAAALKGPFDGCLMIDLYYPNMADGASAPARRCGVELDTGNCHPLENTWQTDAFPEPALLLAAGEDTLWLAMTHSPAGSVTVDDQGRPSRNEGSTAQTVLADAREYLTGGTETRPVTTLTETFTAHIPH